jgi:hypothetical protein
MDVGHISLSCVIILCPCILLKQFCYTVLAIFPLTLNRPLFELLSNVLEVFEVIKLQLDVLLFKFHLLVLLSEWLALV